MDQTKETICCSVNELRTVSFRFVFYPKITTNGIKAIFMTLPSTDVLFISNKSSLSTFKNLLERWKRKKITQRLLWNFTNFTANRHRRNGKLWTDSLATNYGCVCVCVCVSSVRWLNFNKVNHSDTKYCTILSWYRSRCWTQANSYTVIFLSVNYTLIKATTLRWLMVLVHVIALFNVDFSDYISKTDFRALSLSLSTTEPNSITFDEIIMMWPKITISWNQKSFDPLFETDTDRISIDESMPTINQKMKLASDNSVSHWNFSILIW